MNTKKSQIPKVGETYKMDFNGAELYDMKVTDIREVKILGLFPVTNIYLKGGKYNRVTARLRLSQFRKMCV